MNKTEADRLITQYVKKLFGFARQRLSDISEAEEFASELTIQVYQSLLKAHEIANVDGYVWRVAKNCYARHISGRKQFVAVDGIEYLPDSRDITQELLDSESCGILRREITYLGKIQREVIIFHYFRDKKVREIAELLSIPENTVKWHLACSRKELREGMEMARTTGTLGTQPIRFISMGLGGTDGEKGDTSTFLAKTITQNIAYAAYHQPRTINEIAEELGINPIFVEEEVAVLEEYGFMDKLPSGRYRTNIQIYIPNKESYDIYKTATEKYVPLFAEKYFIPALNGITEIPEWISVPDNDLNLYKWSLILPMSDKLSTLPCGDGGFSVKRPDGGDYIAFATLDVKPDWEYDSAEERKYLSCGPMWRNEIADKKWWKSWQFNSYWSDRKLDWHDCNNRDFDKLYFFLRGELPDNAANIESYQQLLDKGYLLKKDGEYKLNIIACESDKRWWEHIPERPEDIKALCEECAAEITKAELIGQPEHMHAQIKFLYRNAAANVHTRMMKYLIENGVLKEPTPEQKKGLCTILFTGE
ncbi:MAG: RNA polymerase sigma factor [Ruminococcaceae bacterium]|nr:RNA polymerase sigma factor [Oscillospiraceae bacterium]